MKTFLLCLVICPMSAMRTSKEVQIICHQNISRKEAFRIQRSNSLPIIFKDSIKQVNSPVHNMSLATDKDVDLVTTISIPTVNEPEKSKTCCTQSRAIVIAAVVTASGVTCAAVLTAIVTLVIHFTT